MSGEPGRGLGVVGKTGDQRPDQEYDARRPDSGVFLSPQTSVERSGQDTATSGDRKSSSSWADGGYHTSTSSSAADLDPSRTASSADQPEDPDDPPADHFILFDDNSTASDPDDDDVDDDDDVRPGAERPAPSRNVTGPLPIPGPSSFHTAHDEALHLMDGTPPRSYNTHPLPRQERHLPDTGRYAGSGFGYRYSTGCLTTLPLLMAALSARSGTPYGDLLATGMRVASGRLQASNRRADPQRKRTTSERQSRDDVTVARDRSLSAPDIGVQRQLIQRQCAQELRKISDEFFEEFHQRKGRTSRAGQSQPAHSSSYPGTSGIKHGLWQAIIQNFSPCTARTTSITSSPSPSSSSTSRPPAQPTNDSANPRIVITKQESGEHSLRHQ